MSILSIPTLGLAFILFLAIHKLIIHPAFLSPLSKIPNAHWSVPFSPLWILWTRFKSRENRVTHTAHQKHGSVIRLAPNELSVSDLDGLRTIYGGGFEKGKWYSIFDNYGSVRKRMISNVYSKSTIHSSPALAAQAQAIIYERLLPILTVASTPTEFPNGIEILEIWNSTAMDFIAAYQFGLKNGSNFLTDETFRKHWLHIFHSRKTFVFWSQELPSFSYFLRKLNIYLVPRWVDNHNKELEAWTQERCNNTSTYLRDDAAATDENPANEPVVFKAILVGMEKERKSKGDASILGEDFLKYPELSIASEMLDHLAAGHETSGIMLTYLSWHLSQDISLQDRLRAELLTLSPNMSLSSATPEIPNAKSLDSLPLLHAILMETLRTDAAIPGREPRVTPKSGCTLGDSPIPGGVRVGAQAYGVHRNDQVYPDATKWDYTRWLDDENGYTEEQRKDRDRWFWAFSSGGRMCVGSNFAMHEIKLVTAAVYSNFRTSIVDDEGMEQEDGYTCGPKSNRLFMSFEKVKRG
ncbi:related to pisatin demethylase cytochrome P450 [Rhynchosporium agropyri]|uniref:Related to pisatin demethylase cytochrome P450 n=1 Tax=Rhynchosporium agropyri TaxID=914238 RepID=A0A1E1LMU5_9HELO|nr:related to pisatin demethylase cytochrome P450 [Rhynchosporium agropyri]